MCSTTGQKKGSEKDFPWRSWNHEAMQQILKTLLLLKEPTCRICLNMYLYLQTVSVLFCSPSLYPSWKHFIHNSILRISHSFLCLVLCAKQVPYFARFQNIPHNSEQRVKNQDENKLHVNTSCSKRFKFIITSR